MFRNAISLKLVVGTYMCGALQCTSHEFPSDFPFIEYFLDLVDKINSLRIKKKSEIRIRNKNWCKRLYASLV